VEAISASACTTLTIESEPTIATGLDGGSDVATGILSHPMPRKAAAKLARKTSGNLKQLMLNENG
jgi:hypothetical protein